MNDIILAMHGDLPALEHLLLANGGSDYTQYRGYISLNSGHYYFQPYQDQTINEITLSEDLLNVKDAQEYLVAQAQQINVLN